jgi:streptogramin lyase
MWVASSANDTLAKIDTAAATPSVADTVTTAEGAPDGPFEVAYDGSHIWVTGILSSDLRRFDPNAGAIVGAPIPAAVNPSGVVFDGTNLWVATGGTVIKYLAN